MSSVLKTKKQNNPIILNAFKTDNTSALNLMIDKDLHFKLKIRSVQEKKTMTEIINTLIKQYLKTNK